MRPIVSAALGTGVAVALTGAVSLAWSAGADAWNDHPRAGGADAVSMAQFNHLEGQVEDLQRRVATLERGRGKGNPKGGGVTSQDDWEGNR